MKTLVILISIASAAAADVVMTSSNPPMPHRENYHFADYCFDLDELVEITREDGSTVAGTADVNFCYTSAGYENWSFHRERISIVGTAGDIAFEFVHDGTDLDDNLEIAFRGDPFNWYHVMTFAYKDYGDFDPVPAIANGAELYGVTSASVLFTREEVPRGPLPADGTIAGDLVDIGVDVGFDWKSETGPVRRIRATSAAAAVASVPEPSAAMLVGFVALLAAFKRWGSARW